MHTLCLGVYNLAMPPCVSEGCEVVAGVASKHTIDWYLQTDTHFVYARYKYRVHYVQHYSSIHHSYSYSIECVSALYLVFI